MGIPEYYACMAANSRKGHWLCSNLTTVKRAMSKERLINSGFYDLATAYQSVHVNYWNRRVPNGTHGGVRGRELITPSYSIFYLVRLKNHCIIFPRGFNQTAHLFIFCLRQIMGTLPQCPHCSGVSQGNHPYSKGAKYQQSQGKGSASCSCVRLFSFLNLDSLFPKVIITLPHLRLNFNQRIINSP